MEIKDLKSFKEIKPSEASKVIGGKCIGSDGGIITYSIQGLRSSKVRVSSKP